MFVPTTALLVAVAAFFNATNGNVINANGVEPRGELAVRGAGVTVTISECGAGPTNPPAPPVVTESKPAETPESTVAVPIIPSTKPDIEVPPPKSTTMEVSTVVTKTSEKVSTATPKVTPPSITIMPPATTVVPEVPETANAAPTNIGAGNAYFGGAIGLAALLALF